MNKIIMYAHGGSGNHGCEAIIRTTSEMFSDCEKILISANPEEDKKYIGSELCTVVKDKQHYNQLSFDFISAYINLRLKHNYIPLDKLDYKISSKEAHKGDIALSVGGDNYCYGDEQKYIMLHDIFIKRGTKTVLWSCSIEPSLLQRDYIAKDISKYDLITARETISYNALKKVNPNTYLVSDVAFNLDAKKPKSLPYGFEEGNTVGINISPIIKNNEKATNITFKNYLNLIYYIIKNTNMQIALIPHVIWDDNDDRKLINELYNSIKDKNRIVIIKDCNCCELKGIISKCRFFIGARTHATIAAYSSCVPTLAIGYSIKAKGIARDIFGDENGYVLPVNDLLSNNDITEAFVNILKSEAKIKEYLKKIMPKYKERSYQAIKLINNIK